MKNKYIFLLSVCLFGLMSPLSAQVAKAEKKVRPADASAAAARKEKPAGGAEQKQNVFAYDANRNGQLDFGEMAKLVNDFADKKAPAPIARFDKDLNGQLDAKEAGALQELFAAKASARQDKTVKPEKPKAAKQPK